MSSSHQQYLDSLRPPSEQDLNRLWRLQEDHERQHKDRGKTLRHHEKATAHQATEARRDFMTIRVLNEAAEEASTSTQGHHHSVFSQVPIYSRSNSQSNISNDGDLASEKCVNENVYPKLLQARAAILIQRTYRGYRVRREIQGLGLDASTRWMHAIRDVQWKVVTKPRAREKNSDTRSNARRNWMKAVTIVRRAAADEGTDCTALSRPLSLGGGVLAHTDPAGHEELWQKERKAQAKRRKHARMMELQYFLEIVDLKHRYGSNLRAYHEEWKRSDTNENFFYWLDYGEGTNVALPTCPRERLDRERVRYLNREERQHYLVKVDHEGRLVWAKNGMRIDTTGGWKDSIHGIVPADNPTPAFSEVERHMQDSLLENSEPSHQHSDNFSTRSSLSTFHSSREAELEAARAAKYANVDLDYAKGVKKLKRVSAATIFNKLLRKSVRKNTWIFVTDTSFRLYVGIKSSGAFQHSSFLHGSRISAAGLIKIKDGRLSSLSPLSGHYRPPTANFRAFVHSLEDEGVDMSHVSISRSYAVLIGLEMYVKTRRNGKEVLKRMMQKKTKVFKPGEAKKIEEDACDKSQSAARERRVLEKEREAEERRHEEAKVGAKILKKLGMQLSTRSGPKNGGLVAVVGEDQLQTGIS